MEKDIIQKKALQQLRAVPIGVPLVARFQTLARFSEESNANYGEVKLTFGETENAQEEGYALGLILRVVTPKA